MQIGILGKLTYSKTKEEGVVKINWEAMPGDVVMLDILQDWIVELTAIYEAKRNEVFNQGVKK
jgi:hypothetical protein